MRRLGLDIDGVFAEFNRALRQRACEVVGRELCAFADPTQWDYLQPQYGLTPQEEAAVWESVLKDEEFWVGLPPEAGAQEALRRLWKASENGTDVYFLTNRPGVKAKYQTEKWLIRHGFSFGSVLITREKGPVARGLGLTAFLDDKPENCLDVYMHAPKSVVYLLRRPWNAEVAFDCPAIVVDSIEEFLEKEGVA